MSTVVSVLALVIVALPEVGPGTGTRGLASSVGRVEAIKDEGGAEILLLRRGVVPWSSFRVALRFGAALDPPGRVGLARVAGLVIAAGLEASASSEGPRLLGRLGARIDVETGQTSTMISGGVPSEHLDQAMSSIIDALAHPSITEPILKRAQTRANEERARELGDDRLRAGIEVRKRLFGGPAVRANASPSPTFHERPALTSITADDVRALLERQVHAESVVIGVNEGAPHRADLEVRAAKWGGALPRGRTGKAESVFPRSARAGLGRRIVIIDKPDASEAHVVIGHLIDRPSDPIRTPALLAVNAVLGGSFSSRLSRVLVERHHLVPLVISSVEPPAIGAMISIWFPAPPALAPRALRIALEELKTLARSGLDDDEIDLGRAYAAGRAALELRDPARQVRAAVTARLLGLGAESPESLPEEIAKIGAGEMRAALAALIGSDDFVIAVVASATPALQAELAAISGVKDVSIVGPSPP